MNPASKKTADQAIEILIVEDSPTQAEQLRHLLEGHGYKVTAAANGRKALEEARKRKPDIIISDIVMPQMDGFAFCNEIKSKKQTKDIPVILLTALSSPQDVIKGLQCGADNFIRKPYDDKYLLSRMDYLLTNRELRKSEKVQVGLKIRFAGEDYLITSERQQILDLLISTYEEAVYLNSGLVRSNESLAGLYRIAVDLNGSLGVQSVAEKTLARAVELPGVRAGWIFLDLGEAAGLRVVATRGLPAALEIPGSLEGDCLCRRRLLSGELDRAVNVLECERLQKAKGDAQGLRYHASVPLWSDGRKLGVLNLAGGEQGMFSDDELKILHGVGNQVAVALERALLYESLENKVEERTAALRAEIAERERAQDETRRNLKRIRALHEIDLAITSTLELRTILDVLLEKISFFFNFPVATTVRLLNQATEKLEPVTCLNINESVWKAQDWKFGRGLTNLVAETSTPIAVRNIDTDPRVRDREFFRRYNLISFLGVPLVAKRSLLGVFSVYTKEAHEFSDEEIDFLNTLAGQAAIAIHNAQLHDQTKKQAEALERSNRVKDEFLSVMSHELRTPLSVIMGYTGLLKEGMLGPLNPQQEDALKKVLGRAAEQLNMINDIMQTTQLEARSVIFERYPASVAGLMEQLRGDYQNQSSKSAVKLVWNYPEGPIEMTTDGAKLKQILQNLINNALKFTDTGTITVSARVNQGEKRKETDESHADADIEFTVADTGVGIPKDRLPTIFDKFYQVDSSETRLYGGVGLGLYIVKNFTEALGGKVEVKSEPGKGTTFTVTIPCGP